MKASVEYLKIREAKLEDYPELREIFLASRRENFHWADANEMALGDFDKQTEKEFILLAEENTIILGFTALYLPDNFIHHLFVHPDHAGKGVGRQLLDAAIESMRKPIRLKCVSANHKAMKFYENNGWERVVEEEKHGEKYWVMEFR